MAATRQSWILPLLTPEQRNAVAQHASLAFDRYSYRTALEELKEIHGVDLAFRVQIARVLNGEDASYVFGR